LECLKCHPRLKFLADSIPDPEAPDKIIPRLYLLVRGVPTDARMEVLNSVMCFFGESLFLKSYDGQDLSKLPPDERAKVSRHNCSCYHYFWELLTNYFFLLLQAEYQPGTLKTYHKQIFAEFKRNGILIEQKLLTKRPGNYDQLWRERMEEAVKHRSDYATLPKQAIVEVNENVLLRTKANPPWNFDLFEDVMDLFVFVGMKIFILRASKEVRLCVCLVVEVESLLT
jgi:hypothetical protein